MLKEKIRNLLSDYLAAEEEDENNDVAYHTSANSNAYYEKILDLVTAEKSEFAAEVEKMMTADDSAANILMKLMHTI